MIATPKTVALQVPEIWAALSSIDLKILDELAFLCRCKAKTNLSGKPWCHPGRVWLAQRLRCSVVTISRHVSKLRRLGVLDAFQPRKVHGRWQTNVYRLVSRAAWRMARIRVLIERVAHRTIPLRSPLSPETARRSTFDTRLEFNRLYAAWMDRGKAPDPASGA